MQSLVHDTGTLSPPLGDLVLYGISIRASPNLEILGVKFDSKLTFEDHVRGIFSYVTQRIGILRLVKRIFVGTSVLLRCYAAFVLPILEYCSPVWRSVAVSFSILSKRCIRWSGFVPIRVSCRCVIDVVRLDLVCCTRLIRTLITLCSASFELFLLEFDSLRPQLIHWCLKYQGRTSQFARPFLPALRFECGITFPTLCLTPERWVGSRVQFIVGCFPELCFLQFALAQVVAGLRKQFIKNYVFPT